MQKWESGVGKQREKRGGGELWSKRRGGREGDFKGTMPEDRGVNSRERHPEQGIGVCHFSFDYLFVMMMTSMGGKY